MKSFSIIPILIILFLIVIPAQTWEHYKPSLIDDIIAITDDDIKSHGKNKGVSTYLGAYRFEIIIKEFPKPITEGSQWSLEHLFKMSPMDKKLMKLYTHEMNFEYKERKFCFLFQESLLKPLKEENKIGDKIMVYAVFGLFNSFGSEHVLLVNRFDTLNRGELKSFNYILKKIVVIENNPLGEEGKEALKEIIEFTTNSEDVYVELSGKTTSWLSNKTKYDAILLGSFFAGNIKTQLLKKKKENDSYSGMLCVISTYEKIKMKDKMFLIEDIEKQIVLQKQGKLKDYIISLEKK